MSDDAPPAQTAPAGIRQRISHGLALVGWFVAVGLLAGILIAPLAGDAPAAVAFAGLLLQTFSFHAGLIVVVFLIVSLVLRRWRLGTALLLCVMLTVGPSALRSLRPALPAVDDDRTLTVLSCNLCYGRADADRLVAWIDEVDPDVIVLQEHGGRWPQYVRDRLGDRYPHAWEEPREDAFGQATLSRLPFVDTTRSIWPPDWSIPSGRVTVRFGRSLVDVTNVHVFPPVSLDWVNQQRRQLDALSLDASRRLGVWSPTSGSDVQGSILIGDFNTPWSTSFMAAMRYEPIGWDARYLWEAHHEIGRGRGATWGPTRGLLSLAPGVRLDHAIYGGELEPVFSVVGPDVGSDHRPIAVGFRWR